MTHTLHLPKLDNFHVVFFHRDKDEESKAKEYVSHVDDSIELYVLEEGNVSFIVGGTLYRLEVGDVILSKPNEPHNCIQNSDCVHKHFCFWFSPTSEELLSSFLMHPNGAGNLIRLSPEDKRQLLTLCDKICKKTEQGEKLSAYSAAVAILEMCRSGLSLSMPGETFPNELLLVMQTISTDVSSIVSIKDLCDKCFISQSTLNRLFSKYVGTSPKTYLQTSRLALARNYLKEGYSVTETAFLVGFTDVSSFIRLFRTRFGISPLKYKQQIKKN